MKCLGALDSFVLRLFCCRPHAWTALVFARCSGRDRPFAGLARFGTPAVPSSWGAWPLTVAAAVGVGFVLIWWA
jgi:hypothetical protein